MSTNYLANSISLVKGADLLPNSTRLPLGHFLWKYGNPLQFGPEQSLCDFIDKMDRLKTVKLESCIPFDFLIIMLRNQLVSFDGLSNFYFTILRFRKLY